MLRVCYSDTIRGQRWTLCGHLAGPWVDEFRSCWRQARSRTPRAAAAVVDLSDVIFIDEAGEELLTEMHSAGVEFIATGVENKHMLANLEAKGKRPLRRQMDCLGADCRESITHEGGD
jgi:hypothetical protein